MKREEEEENAGRRLAGWMDGWMNGCDFGNESEKGTVALASWCKAGTNLN